MLRKHARSGPLQWTGKRVQHKQYQKRGVSAGCAGESYGRADGAAGLRQHHRRPHRVRAGAAGRRHSCGGVPFCTGGARLIAVAICWARQPRHREHARRRHPLLHLPGAPVQPCAPAQFFLSFLAGSSARPQPASSCASCMSASMLGVLIWGHICVAKAPK